MKTILIGTVLLPPFNLVAANEWKKAELAILNYWFFIGYCNGILEIKLCTLIIRAKNNYNPMIFQRSIHCKCEISKHGESTVKQSLFHKTANLIIWEKIGNFLIIYVRKKTWKKD